MRKAIFLVALTLKLFSGSAQVTEVPGGTQLRLQLKQSKPDSSRVEILNSLIQFYFHKRGHFKTNLDSALFYGQEAWALSDSLHNHIQHQRTMMYIGETYFVGGNYQKGKESMMEVANYFHATSRAETEGRVLQILAAKAMFYKFLKPELVNFSKEALQIYRRLGDQRGIMNSYMITGAIYDRLNIPDSAAVYLLNALPIAVKFGGDDKYKVYVSLGRFYRDRGDNAKALSSYFAELKDLQDRHLSEKFPEWAELYINIGSTYETYDKKLAYKYFNMAMTSALVNKNEAGMPQFFSALSSLIKTMCGDGQAKAALIIVNNNVRKYPPVQNTERALIATMYGQCYSALHENKLAEKSYLEAVDLNDGDPAGEQAARADLANYYSATKQFEKNKRYLNNAGLPKQGVPFINSVMEELQLARLDSAKGDYLSALNHYQKYKLLNDTVYNAVKAKEIAGLTIQYETKEKEQAIRLLKSESRSQRTDLRRINLQRNITLGGIVISLFISGLIFYGYSQKQRSNRLLTAQKNEIDRKNETLEKLNVSQENLLNEKDWLLKEVHHRVKNNLQIVMSLLSSQSAYLENTAAIEAIRASQSRVYAISLIHQKLYKSSNVANISMPAYVADLLEYLAESFDTRKRHIIFEQVIEPFNVDLAQAVPIGLILNESVTNALKYAFGDSGGQIIVALQLIKDETLLLTIADNGKGLPATLDPQNTTTLGMEMMKALSKQLGGELKIDNSSGVRISLEFQIEKVLSGLAEKSHTNS